MTHISERKIGLKIAAIFLFLFMIVPVFSYAQNETNPSLPPSGQTTSPQKPVVEKDKKSGGIVYVCTQGAPGECTFEDVIIAIKNLLNFATVFALSFSVVVLAYAGFTYMTSEGSPSERSRANQMLLSVVKGIIFILAAWVIVHLIVSTLLGDGYSNIIPQ